MSVKKIFMMLITVVACVMIGAFLLNVIMPNAIAQVINAVENAIAASTGFSFDLNGDGSSGNEDDIQDVQGDTLYQDEDESVYGDAVTGMEGWQ